MAECRESRRAEEVAKAETESGHADIRTTMKYSDMTEERKRKAAQLLDYGLHPKPESV